MTPILAGIYTLYSNNAALKAALTGGLHFEVAPQGTSLPYGVYTIVVGRTDYHFTRIYEYITVQFDIYAASNSTRSDIYGKLTTVYDDAKPTATGYTSIIMERKTEQFLREGDQNQVFRAIVEYQAIIEKAIS